MSLHSSLKSVSSVCGVYLCLWSHPFVMGMNDSQQWRHKHINAVPAQHLNAVPASILAAQPTNGCTPGRMTGSTTSHSCRLPVSVLVSLFRTIPQHLPTFISVRPPYRDRSVPGGCSMPSFTAYQAVGRADAGLPPTDLRTIHHCQFCANATAILPPVL